MGRPSRGRGLRGGRGEARRACNTSVAELVQDQLGTPPAAAEKRQLDDEEVDSRFLELADDGRYRIEAGGGGASSLIHGGGGASEAISAEEVWQRLFTVEGGRRRANRSRKRRNRG